MPRLDIQNFGPIQSFHFDIKKLNVLIGKQASGKSTAAKLLFFLKMMPLWLATFARDNKNANHFELFQKELRKQFINLFGPVYHQHNVKIEYRFDDSDKNSFIQIYQSRSGNHDYITIKFDKNTRAKIENLLSNSVNLPSKEKKSGGSISYDTLNDILEGNVFKIISEKAKKIFSQRQTPIFIPAGRTQLALFPSSAMGVSGLEKDIITGNFLNAMRSMRTLAGDGLEEAELLARKTWPTPPPADRARLARLLIERILRGRYRVVNGDERIYHGDSGHTKLSVASSGQQESLWILLIAYVLILQRENVFVTIEEPEAHLYPESQDAITRLLVLLLGSAPDNQIIITTHSPYLLTSVNNLLAAWRCGEKNHKRASEIINPLLWLSGKELSVYQLDGDGEDIFDRSLNMIRAEKIDSASSVMNAEYDDMLALEEE